MANFTIPENASFSDTLRMIETSDPVHANIVNPLLQTLLYDSVYLYRKCLTLEEQIAKAQSENIYGGNKLSPQATASDQEAQYPVITAVSSADGEKQMFEVSVSDIRKGLYSVLLRLKVSANTDTANLLKISVSSAGGMVEDRVIKASMFDEAEAFQTFGFDADFSDLPVTIKATLLKNGSGVRVSVYYMLLQVSHTAITSL